MPRSLFEQFRRLANQYFLGVALLMAIGPSAEWWYSPMQAYTTIGPLAFILLVTMLKEGLEDLKRHRSDREVNARAAEVLETADDGSARLARRRWADVRPGDLLVVRDHADVAADAVLLASSDEAACAHVETANIDGETNLKLKHCAPTRARGAAAGGKWATLDALAAGGGERVEAEFEAPNARIHTFTGALRLFDDGREGGREVALDHVHLLLRGSTLRNTEWAVGLVVHVGDDAKIVRNARDAPSKLSAVERVVNAMVVFILGCMALLTSVCFVSYLVWTRRHDRALWYLCESSALDAQQGAPPLFAANCLASDDQYPAWGMWVTFFILYCNFIPISLYVTVEIINFAQAAYIEHDVAMHDAASDVAALARTSNMGADLGQIEYVFSDKTGTLTCNEMRFRRCSVGGQLFGASLGPAPAAAEPARAGGDADVTETDGFSDRDDDDDDGAALAAGEAAAGDDDELGRPLAALRSLALSAGGDAGADAAAATAAETARDFAMLLAVCHTVVLGRDDDDGSRAPGEGARRRPQLQAESPDEEALVLGALDELGVEFAGRSRDECRVRLHRAGEPVDERWRVLAVIPFDSARKRMSVVVRRADAPAGGRSAGVRLLCKGADSAIFALASDYSRVRGGRAALDRHLSAFACDGLRTLAIAQRDVSEAEWAQWSAAWHAAQTATAGRAAAMAAAAAEIERELCVLGATAIEDRLQDDVGATIAGLADAGVKLWVLTGDKVETAINIASSCRLIDREMFLLRLDEHAAAQAASAASDERAAARAAEPGASDEHKGLGDPERPPPAHRRFSVDARLEQIERLVFRGAPDDGARADPADEAPASADAWSERLEQISSEHTALVVDDAALSAILEHPEREARFLRVACSCRAVVACRVSPSQKRLLVRLVKKRRRPTPITLAIGDGANDVGMIQEAHVGVGISGKEGRQAVNASDFAIAQFRFLERLLLVHGRWNYRRNAKVIRYSFFKNIVLVFALFFFQIDCGFSGQTLYESMVYSGFNFFLGLTPFAMGFFDRDVSVATALRFPALYMSGRLGMDLNVAHMAFDTALAIACALVVYYFAKLDYSQLPPLALFGSGGGGALGGARAAPGEADVWTFGTSVFSGMVLGMSAFSCTLIDSWVRAPRWLPGGITLAAVGLQPVMFYTFTLFMGETAPALSYQYYGVPYRAFSRLGGGWLVPLVVAAGVGALALVARALHLQFFATPVDHGLELDRGLGDDAERAPPTTPRASAAVALADAAEAGLGAKDTCWRRPFATTVQADTTLLSASGAAAPAASPPRRRGASLRRRGHSINDDPSPAFGPLRRLLARFGLGDLPRASDAVQRPAPRSAPDVADDTDGVLGLPGARSSFVFDNATTGSYHGPSS